MHTFRLLVLLVVPFRSATYSSPPPAVGSTHTWWAECSRLICRRCATLCGYVPYTHNKGASAAPCLCALTRRRPARIELYV